MKKLLNDGWLFAKLPAGSTYEAAETAVFTPVDLPHDWLIWQENDLYESADAWYRRNVELPAEHDPVVTVRFDGVYMDCDVLLNGEIITTHPYGYTAFDVPLTGKLNPGGNLLEVHIRHQSPNSRWYSGSGIFRDVTLVTVPEDHLVPDGWYITEKQEQGEWILDVSAETAGSSAQAFHCMLTDREGKTAAESDGMLQDGTARAVLRLSSGRMWSPEDPYLYTLTMKYGKQTEVCRIGLRSVALDPNRGLILNGSPVKLKGVCLHHDLGALGAAFHEKAARRQLKLMKEMGANAVRTSHNPPAAAFLDLCDEMGILVDDEAFDMWERSKTEYDYARFFPDWYRSDVAAWVRRDRCHPSVILWSIGNEIYDMHADERGAEVTRLLAEEVRLHDPMKHAYVTFGCNYMPWEGGQRCAEYVDAVGYNYGEKYYEKHHREHPDWVIYGSETASMLFSRGIYHFPISRSIMSDADLQCSALGNSNTSWGAESLPKILTDDLRNSYSMGQFIWSGIDYIGEPTPYHTRSCYFGQADTACFPKDSYYLFQSLWTDRKMIRIGVSWDWNAGQIIDVPVTTSCAEAELFLNGESLGRKKAGRLDPDLCVPVWHIPFRPGKLEAKGYDESGNVIAEDCRQTSGDTDHFLLSCEDGYLLSDGWDLAFVTVSAADERNLPVENARDRVCVTVTGGGRLIGTDNGDSTDPDGYKQNCRRLFNGKLLLIIASNGKNETVLVRAESGTGISGSLEIPCRYAPMKEGISCIQGLRTGEPGQTVPARRLDIRADTPVMLTPDNPEYSFGFSPVPRGAGPVGIVWQVTNAAGIEAPYADVSVRDCSVSVRARGDGLYYLRALCGQNGNCDFISQIEFRASGFGNPALDPYGYISAGLYDLHEGEIGAGNEKGIAFSRDGESMAGFSLVDFGKAGSDTLTADIFALNGDPYEIELWAGEPGKETALIDVLHYRKPSIWNVYQPETWKLSRRLSGVMTLCFRMRDKVHMKGFSFKKQERAFIAHEAGSADSIYGDQFRPEGGAVKGIGNNVTMTWADMDFGGEEELWLELDGSTPLSVNSVTVRIRNGAGEERTSAADFKGPGPSKQRFRVKAPGGSCSVSFVFLPGSSFDFNRFRFYGIKCWTETEE